MTRFIGDAIGVRAGKGKPITGKDMKKNMAAFQLTGRHPELEAAQAERDSALPTLPERDINHSFVFLDISIGGKPAGRVIIELFCDLLPAAGNHFRNRCLPGSSASLVGTSFHKLIPHYAAFGSKREALRVGLSNKGSASAADSSAAGSKRSAEGPAGTSSKSQAAAGSSNRIVKSKFLDTMLGGDSDTSSDDDS
ncbi:MAG: hypothetical protein WDW38_001282 [Sanguina aurantia]